MPVGFIIAITISIILLILGFVYGDSEKRTAWTIWFIPIGFAGVVISLTIFIFKVNWYQ